MGLLQRLFAWAEMKSVATSLELFREMYSGREVRSGVTVNWKTALDVATVLACVRAIANGVSQVPFRPYLETAGGRLPAVDHPLHPLLYRRPNSWQTSYEFRETMMLHVLLTWNSYVFLNRVGSRREIREMIPLEPHRVSVKQNPDLSLTYTVTGANGSRQEFAQDAIWHLRGPSWNSWMGLEAVHLARESIGLAIATEQAHAEMHKNSARVSGLLSVDQNLSPEKFEFLAAWIDKHVMGGERSHKPMIADLGAKWTSMQMTGVDAQHVETRKHQIEEICRAFGVMPIMVGHADKTATYASAEQMFLAHVVHTLSPWYQRIEQSADVNLLSEADRAAGYYTKFTPNALMRGAAKDRADFYAKALGAGGGKGWMTQNDIRSLEELDRSDDPEADKLPQPMVRPSGPPAASDPEPEEE